MANEQLKERIRLDDMENPEWTEADFARARPAGEVLGKASATALVRGRGRPPKPAEERKRQVTLRMAPDVIEAARASGRGWQVRAEKALRHEFLGENSDKVSVGKVVRGAVRGLTERVKSKRAGRKRA